jgi:GMP reductase
LTCLHKHYSKDELSLFFDDTTENHKIAFYTLGIKEGDFNKLRDVLEGIEGGVTNIKFLCCDVANGYTDFFVERVKKLREVVGPDAVIMAGNVCTPEMVQELLIAGGVDIVKVGIGPGSVCTTRIKTGVGYPQLSAIAECAEAAHGMEGHVCADGGCRTPGDVVKAFAAGADFVMLGGMLAGTEECDGEWQYSYMNAGSRVEMSSKKSLKFYGMSSKEAQVKYDGGLKHYRAAEGKCVEVPYKGTATNILSEIMGGLRSACAYVGTNKLKNLSRCTTFIKVRRTHNTIFGG